jgi:hypothetical protein
MAFLANSTMHDRVSNTIAGAIYILFAVKTGHSKYRNTQKQNLPFSFSLTNVFVGLWNTNITGKADGTINPFFFSWSKFF